MKMAAAPRAIFFTCASVWLAVHRGVGGIGLGLVHALTLPVDPLANTAGRLLLVTWWVGEWAGCNFFHAGTTTTPCQQHHTAWLHALSIAIDVVALAIMSGAQAEPALCALSVPRVAKQHAAWINIVQRVRGGRWLAAIATPAEWFLILDLVWSRVFHASHPTNRRDKRAVVMGGCHNQPPLLAIVMHGLDSDASSMALLAHVLVLHGMPVALCDYHADFDKGYMHTGEDSIDCYASTCLAQVDYLLTAEEGEEKKRVVLVGHSLGGLVALRMATRLASSKSSAPVSGVLTVCSPIAGVPLLTHLNQHYPTLRDFLKNVRKYAWWDPRRHVGELIRVEPWIWDEMLRRERDAEEQRDKREEEDCGFVIKSAGAGQDAIVPSSSAQHGTSSNLHFAWASHYNVLLSRFSCEVLASATLAIVAEKDITNKSARNGCEQASGTCT
jgi:pimeloyl-ACP methyl ester carboxylesterase